MNSQKRSRIAKLCIAAMCMALCYLLPYLTGNMPQIGNMLCLMHIPVLLCGFICGPWYALAVGLISPLLRSFIVGAPPLYPIAIAMAVELATYGLISGLMYRLFPKRIPYIYVSLLSAMVVGRAVWGVATFVLMGIRGTPFGWSAFISGSVLNAIPGIVLQIVIIPLIVIALRKSKLLKA